MLLGVLSALARLVSSAMQHLPWLRSESLLDADSNATSSPTAYRSPGKRPWAHPRVTLLALLLLVSGPALALESALNPSFSLFSGAVTTQPLKVVAGTWSAAEGGLTPDLKLGEAVPAPDSGGSTPTSSPTPSSTPDPTPSAAPSPTPSPSATPTPSATPSPSPSSSPVSSPS